MLNDFIISTFENKLGFTPTKSQKDTLQHIAEFICSEKIKIYILKGYAGTGKTSLISSIVQSLNSFKLKSVLLAPTGRAAKVISSYTKRKATTIHKKIYRLQSIASENSKFLLNQNLHTNTVFIVDEASMISSTVYENSMFGTGSLLDDLIDFVEQGRNCKLLIVGDEAQLPPIGYSNSPALEIINYVSYHDDEIHASQLTDIVRQSEESGILFNATIIRNLINKNTPVLPQLHTKLYPDIIRLNGAELIEELTSSYDNVGIENTIVITRSNKRANKYNEGIRRAVLWKEEEISIGDQLMIVKNNYFGLDEYDEIDFIANGDIAQINRISRYEELHNLRFVQVSLSFPDYNNMDFDCRIILDTLHTETPALNQEQNKELFYSVAADYADVRNKRDRYQKIKSDPFFNALQVKFAYAITCHKAQGGQWDHVYIDLGYLPEETLDIESMKWLYTAITRAKNKVYLVNFKKEFFEEDE